MAKPQQYKRTLNSLQAERVIRMHQELTIVLLQRYVTYCLLAVFILNGVSALAIIFLVGYGQIVLSEKLIVTILAETVAQAAAVFVMVIKFLFPGRLVGAQPRLMRIFATTCTLPEKPLTIRKTPQSTLLPRLEREVFVQQMNAEISPVTSPSECVGLNNPG